jgi:hypothetical protein
MKIIAAIPNTVTDSDLRSALDHTHHACSWMLPVAPGPKLAVLWGPNYRTVAAAVEKLGGVALPPLHAPTPLTAAHVAAFAPFAALLTTDTAYSAAEKLFGAYAPAPGASWPALDPAQP